MLKHLSILVVQGLFQFWLERSSILSHFWSATQCFSLKSSGFYFVNMLILNALQCCSICLLASKLELFSDYTQVKYLNLTTFQKRPNLHVNNDFRYFYIQCCPQYFIQSEILSYSLLQNRK